MKNRLVRSLVTASLVAGSILVTTQGSAQAQQRNDSWSTNNVVGNCGQKSGGFVVAAQNFFFASDNLRPVDSVWGTNSDTAAKAFQNRFGLTPDGCVGARTWNQMRAVTFNYCSVDSSACGSAPAAASQFQTRGPNGRVAIWWRSNCDWASEMGGDLPKSPVAAYYKYSFDSALTALRTCA